MAPRLSLVAAAVALVAWVVLTATLPATTAAVNLLFALGTTLLVHWWARTH